MKVMVTLTRYKGAVSARAEYDGSKITVLAGGKVNLNFATHIKGGKAVKVYRDNLDYVDAEGNILKNCEFSSPSTAAQFVTGQSTNGYLAWKVEKKLNLGQYLKNKGLRYVNRADRLMDVSVKIIAIIMHCDEGVLNLELGKGYTVGKCYLEEFPFKSEIENGKKQLNTEYIDSCLYDEKGAYFICLKKEDTFQIKGSQVDMGNVITDKTCQCEDEIGIYQQQELEYLHKIFSLLHLFSEGNIGIYQTFFTYEFRVLGIINNIRKCLSQNGTRNVWNNHKFILNPEQVGSCNRFLRDYEGMTYTIMKPIIDEFVWGLEQIDEPTGFEQYTTALEMTLISGNQPGKKQMLSNRVAVLLGENDIEIRQIHDKMISFYRYRSESLHEGDGSNISEQEFIEMESYTRRVLIRIIEKCKEQLDVDSTTTWNVIKNTLVNELITEVQNKKSMGIL